MHDSLASLLAKRILKVLAVVHAEPVTGDRLTSILVYALEDLVAGSVAKTGEEGEELATDGRRGLVLEDDLVELANIGNLFGGSS